MTRSRFRKRQGRDGARIYPCCRRADGTDAGGRYARTHAGTPAALLETAAAQGATLVVFPELAFTTFFPRWLLGDEELDRYFEHGMPNPAVQPLFDRARDLGVGFYVGYAELTPAKQRFNSAVLVTPAGAILGTYRKVHLPGSVEPRAGARFHQLEKRYFAYGDSAFPLSAPGRTGSTRSSA